MSPVELVLSHLKGVKRNGSGWIALCPAHDDRVQSLKVDEGDDGRALVYCHAGCETPAAMAAMGLAMTDLYPPKPTPAPKLRPKPTGLTLAQYAEYVELPVGFLKEVGLYESDWDWKPAVAFPYKGVDGELIATRYRIGLGPNDFRWPRGTTTLLYGLDRLADALAAGAVWLVEGERDALVLWKHKIPALGIPGAATWRNEWAAHLDGIGRIFAVQEPDESGRALIEKLASSPIADRTVVVRMPEATKDPGELYRANPLDFPEALEELAANAVPIDAAYHGKQVPATTTHDKAVTTDNPGTTTTASTEIEVVCLADVDPEAVEWLWYHRVALKKLTALAGDPDAGKSQISCAIAAAVTTNTPLPGDNASIGPRRVLFLSAEDGIADTIRPRVEAAGGDLALVDVVTVRREEGVEGEVWLNDRAHLANLEERITKGAYALVVIDPLAAYTGDKTDTHKDGQVRSIMKPLATIADRTDAAILCIMHLSKSADARKSFHRILGSVAFSAAVRSVLVAGSDPHDDESRALVQVKTNLARKTPPEGYRIDSAFVHNKNGESIETSRVLWTGTSDLTAEDLLGKAPQDSLSTREQAVEFLKSEIGGRQEREAKILKQQAKEWYEISSTTLWRALKSIKGYQIRLEGPAGKERKAMWSLP